MVKKVLFIMLVVILLVTPLLASCTKAASPSPTSTTKATATTTAAKPPTTSAAPPPPPAGQQPPPAGGGAPPPPPGPAAPLAPRPTSSGKMTVTSAVVKNGGNLGDKYTCNGVNAGTIETALSLPIEWSGLPANTKSIAVIIWHIRGGGDEGIFFLVYNIPPTAKGLPEDMKANTADPKVGTVGCNDKADTYYQSPCGGGPGTFSYTIDVIALSDVPKVPADPKAVDATVLREAMKNIILDSGSMTFNVVI